MGGVCQFDRSLVRRVSYLRSTLSASSHTHGQDRQPVDIEYTTGDERSREGKKEEEEELESAEP